MFIISVNKKSIVCIGAFCILAAIIFLTVFKMCKIVSAEDREENNYIKYVEFNPTYDALEKAMSIDINSNEKDVKISWIDLLSYLAAIYGGDFKKYKASDMDCLAEKLNNGEKIEDLTKDMKHYNYYNEAYTAVLGEFLGSYKVRGRESSSDDDWKEKYGLKVFSPIAKTFPYSHYSDFGASRSYGYARPHLGHDLMAATGTPVISIESGVVEVMGWNQYGGWRVGIRSFDKKRYYYYAHLRQNKPFHTDIKEGETVKAGDVIGYVGRTGYSSKENINNINQSHLHLGMELIFDESQKECNNEIWIDLYSITKLLESNKSAVVRVAETKEFYRELDFIEENVEKNR